RPPRMPEPPPQPRTFNDRAAGVAVPMSAEMTRIIKEKLQQGLEVEYGFVGIRTHEPSSGRVQISPNSGMGIVGGSPAAEAGLEAGDYILSINGHRIAKADDVQFYVATALAGTPVKFEILHEQAVQPKIITLAKSWTPGKIIAANRPPHVRGLRVDYTSVLESRNLQAGFFGRPRVGVHAGVYISEIQPGSKAAAKVRVHDIITGVKVNGKMKALRTPAEFYAAAAKIRADEALELKLHAHNFDGDSTVVIEP
ncbi:MAG TPA: PDZ domain-containing protein, partial [Gemmataceae bacterium]|nr:PDZ domain-containing protein [Gemmataceae bacterium]